MRIIGRHLHAVTGSEAARMVERTAAMDREGTASMRPLRATATPASRPGAPSPSNVPAAHTPGPWRVVEGECFTYSNRFAIVKDEVVGDVTTTSTVAEVWPAPDDRDKADALLIAAAPDMLDTLLELQRVLQVHVDGLDDADGTLGRLMVACDNALARARGEIGRTPRAP